MAITRLVRKALRNRTVSRKRQDNLKRLIAKPVLKNVDIEQIKEEFASKKAAAAAKKPAPVKDEAKVEKEVAPKTAEKPVAEIPAAEVKEEKKESPKKAAPKAKKESTPEADSKEDSAE
jgi:hypothetical protein